MQFQDQNQPETKQETPGYSAVEQRWIKRMQEARMYIVDRRKCDCRPLGVTLLSSLYGLLGGLLLVVPMAALFAGYIPLPEVTMEGFMTAGSIVALITLCGMLAWGLWTLNPQVRIGLMILAGVVMVGFCSELVAGNKLGVAIFGFALFQLIYLSYPDVVEEFQPSQ
jgi:hypothetical protein